MHNLIRAGDRTARAGVCESRSVAIVKVNLDRVFKAHYCAKLRATSSTIDLPAG